MIQKSVALDIIHKVYRNPKLSNLRPIMETQGEWQKWESELYSLIYRDEEGEPILLVYMNGMAVGWTCLKVVDIRKQYREKYKKQFSKTIFAADNLRVADGSA